MSNTTAAPATSLKRNVSWVLIGNLLYAATNWCGSIVYAKLGSPVEVGKYGLAVAICQPIATFAMMNLRAVLATDTRGEHRFADYLGLRVLTTGVGYLAMVIFALVSGRSFDTTLTVLVYGVGASVEMMSDIYNAVLQRYERMEGIGISLAFRGILSLILQTIGFWLTHSVPISMAGYVVASLTGLLLIDIPRARKMRRTRADAFFEVSGPRFEVPVVRALALTSFPLAFSLTLTNLSNQMPRYFVLHYLGERKLGLFSAVAMLINFGSIAMGAAGTSVAPRLARNYRDGDLKAFHRLVRAFTVVGATVGIAGVLLAQVGGKWFLSRLFKPEYAQQSGVFVILMLGGLLLYASFAYGTALTAQRRFKVQATTSIVTFLCATLASAILIPLWGTVGAAWAVVFAMAGRFGALYAMYRKYSHELPPELAEAPKG